MNERKSDIVVLNVGGTLFTSSVSTLVSSSSYFKSRLSDEWQEMDPCGEEPLVIDQDPRLFSVLLSYMRLGSIEADKLTTPAILLAVFFGMDQLLEAVRAAAIRSWFEDINSAIFSAAQAAHLVREDDFKKEYATLTLCHPDFISFSVNRGVTPDFVVFVQLQNKNGEIEQLPNCYTFIDALNSLSKLGYTRYEKEMFDPGNPFGNFIARMWFSKIVADVEDMECTGDDPHSYPSQAETTLIRESNTSLPKKHPRAFCSIIRDHQAGDDELNYGPCYDVLEADVGNNEKSIGISGQISILGGTTVGKTRSVVLTDMSKMKKLNWLQKYGYTTSEHELASAYNTALKCWDNDGKNWSISILSRPLFES